MGNVLAASSPIGTFPVPEPPPLSPEGFTKLGKLEEKTEKLNDLPQPGVMEDLHKRAKDVFPINFDGVKLMVNKGLSNHFQVSHTINFSSNTPSGYRFGATYVGTKQTSPNEAFPILLGDVDPSGNLNANILHQIGERIKVKLACQFTQMKQQPVSATHVQADYRGDIYSASLACSNLDLINGSGLIVAHYLQSITNNIALGAEFAYQCGSHVPGKEIALVSLAGRYNTEKNSFSASIGEHAIHMCYYQKASEQLQFGCELDTNLRIGESTATIGYQIDLPKADLAFKGMVDSNWNVGGVLEKKLGPLPFTLSLSGLMNHSQQQFRLGCGFVIG